MVIGLDKFKDWFADYTDSYVIIGGTACDEHISAAGLTPRATRDIDVILIIEALTPAFVSQFWDFVKAAGYNKKEQERERRNAYRFREPADRTFPRQVELFCRQPDILQLPQDMHITPIPKEEGLSSLSAILLDDDYYHFTLTHSAIEHGVHHANIEALICLKAYAYLDNLARKENGESIDSNKIDKHRKDVFRLLPLLPPNSSFELPTRLHHDMNLFAVKVQDNLPDQKMLQDAGYGTLSPQKLFNQMLNTFHLNPE